MLFLPRMYPVGIEKLLEIYALTSVMYQKYILLIIDHMDIQNLKPVEECKMKVSLQKLHYLVTDLVDNYVEMSFLIEAQEHIKVLENTLNNEVKQQALREGYELIEYFENQNKNRLLHPELIPLLHPRPQKIPAPKIDIINLPNNFTTSSNVTIALKKENSILLYEKLLEQEFVLTADDTVLFNVIKKSILMIYKINDGNIQTELIKFLNIDIDNLANVILQELNSLIKYNPNKKDFNLHTIRFKLTDFCYIIGNLFFDTYFKQHEDPIVRESFNIKTRKEKNLSTYFFLRETFRESKHLKDNVFFRKLFKLDIITNLKYMRFDEEPHLYDELSIDEEFPIDDEIPIDDDSIRDHVEKIEIQESLDNLAFMDAFGPFGIKPLSVVITDITKQKRTFPYKIGQYFYTILRTLILAKDPEGGLERMLLKNKLIEYKIKMGSVFLHAFKKCNLFRENLVWENINRQTILLVPNMIYFPNIIQNIVHQRPYFVYGTLMALFNKYEKSKENYNTREFYIYNICHKRYKLRLHTNPDISLTPTSKNIYEKLPLFSGKHYLKNFEKYTSFVGTIDKNYYYQFLVMLKEALDLKKDIKKFTFEENIARFSNIFLIYKIKPLPLLKAYNTTVLTHKRLLEHLFEYALDFHSQDPGILLKEIEITLRPKKDTDKKSDEWLQYKKSLKFFKDLYNRLFSFKIFIRGLIKECLIYCHFDYFISDAFLDARGRHYLNGFYMNPQSYPLIKAFIKPYVVKKDIITFNDFKTLKTITTNRHDNIINSQEVAALIDEELGTYADYIAKDQLLKLQNIHNLFENPLLSLEELKILLAVIKKNNISYESLFLETLNLVKKYMNSLKLFFVLHSTILLYLNPQEKIANYYELDATASGLQMTSMVLRDASLGELCNLTLPLNSKHINNDIYMLFSHSSSFYLHQLFNTIPLLGISEELLHLSFKLFQYFHYYEDHSDKDRKLIIFLFIQFNNIIHNKESGERSYLYDLCSQFSWLILKKFTIKSKVFIDIANEIYHNTVLSKKHYYDLYNLIYILGVYVHLDKLIYKTKEFPWFIDWLSGRDVFKKAIMTFGYNATSYRRKEQFFKALLEQNENKMSKNLQFLVQIVENLFIYLKDIYLPSAQLLRDLGTSLAENVTKNPHDGGTSLIINNGIFNIEIKTNIKKPSSLIINGLLRGNETWHELQINLASYRTYVIDKGSRTTMYYYHDFDPRTLARKFAPNFIHSMDAWLICLFKFKVNLLNNMLKNSFFITNFTNHDTFSITLAPFLKYILMDIYKNLYFFDYMRTLQQNSGYNELLNLWFYGLYINKCRRLNYRKEAHLGSPVTLIHLVSSDKGYRLKFDIGSSTNLILNPFFVK